MKRKKELEERERENFKMILQVLIKEINFTPSKEMLSDPYIFSNEIYDILKKIEPNALRNKVLLVISDKILKQGVPPQKPTD